MAYPSHSRSLYLFPLARFPSSLHCFISPLHPPYYKESLYYFVSIDLPSRIGCLALPLGHLISIMLISITTSSTSYLMATSLIFPWHSHATIVQRILLWITFDQLLVQTPYLVPILLASLILPIVVAFPSPHFPFYPLIVYGYNLFSNFLLM